MRLTVQKFEANSPTIFEIDGREPKRIGDERKMRPLTTGAQLSYQIIKEFILTMYLF